MGLISFVKNAGKALFGNKEEEQKIEREVQQKADTARERLEELKKERALENRVREMGFEVEDLGIDIQGSTAVVRGKAADQATAERVALAVGNTNGIDRVDNRIDVEAKAAEATFYTVESGDTLSKIAKEHYGNANEYMKIFEANRPMLEDPDKIYPGQVLRIPAKG